MGQQAMRQAAIVSPLRTAVGGFGGALRPLATLHHELERRGGRYGLETLCIGGGQGLAAVFERP